MKSTTEVLRLSLLAAMLAAAIPSAEAAITLTIVEFTTTRFTVTVSGTQEIDANIPSAIGTSPSLFGIVLNKFATTAFYTGSPVQVSNTLSTSSSNPTNAGMSASGSGLYGLFFSFDQTFPQYAGSQFAGSATFTGNFNPAAAQPGSFQLWSGFNNSNPQSGFSVFHTNAVPEPTTFSLLAACGTMALLKRRRRAV